MIRQKQHLHFSEKYARKLKSVVLRLSRRKAAAHENRLITLPE
jgi:hypothetical protein